jgi:hypothetical protein
MGRFEMSKERASDLARHCTELVRKGNDFTTVWSTLLKDHTLVEGIPREMLERNRNLLCVSLTARVRCGCQRISCPMKRGRGTAGIQSGEPSNLGERLWKCRTTNTPLKFTGGGLSGPGKLMIDSQGNAWAALGAGSNPARGASKISFLEKTR